MGMDAREIAWRDELVKLGVAVTFDASLGDRTWYGVGGRAAALVEPGGLEELAKVMRYCRVNEVPVRVLGRGANLLVLESGVDGVVVALGGLFKEIEIDGTRVTAGGGADLAKVIMTTARAGLGGLEVLAGIPATVGGAVRMNAGGRYGEIGPRVESVTVMDAGGEVRVLGGEAITFGYRSCSITEPVVVSVTFALERGDAGALRERVKEIFDYKKSTQPLAAKSAGCCFKNPVGQSEKGAGQLIDEAGLKGYRVGGAMVSGHHANFVTLDPGGRADDVLAVMEHVEREVARVHGITLRRELVVWGGGKAGKQESRKAENSEGR